MFSTYQRLYIEYCCILCHIDLAKDLSSVNLSNIKGILPMPRACGTTKKQN